MVDHIPNIFEGYTQKSAKKQLCGNTLKRNELKVYISLKENKMILIVLIIEFT